jgi:Asp-tRNA(Asn)/Glu-tRNA(Gln) amidotransferase A subunit family amidase
LDHVGFFTNDLETANNAAKCLVDDWKEQETLKEKPVFGVPEGRYLEKASSEMLNHFRGTLKRIQNTGYEVKNIPVMPDFEDIVERHNLIVAAEAAQNHKVWFEKYKEKYHPKTAALLNRGKEIRSDMLTMALKGKETLRDHLSSLMSAEGIDLWLSPSAVGAAPKGLDSTGDPIMNLPWTHSGLPTLNIPSGKNPAGLPLGLQVAAGWYEDEKLFAYSQHILAALRDGNS